MFSKLLKTHRTFKRLAMALNRLCVCTGWSELLLVAHTALLEISCRDSNVELWHWPSTLREESTGDRQTDGLTERFAISPTLFNRVKTRSSLSKPVFPRSSTLFIYIIKKISQCMRFPTMWYVRPANPQISLRIRAV